MKIQKSVFKIKKEIIPKQGLNYHPIGRRNVERRLVDEAGTYSQTLEGQKKRNKISKDDFVTFSKVIRKTTTNHIESFVTSVLADSPQHYYAFPS